MCNNYKKPTGGGGPKYELLLQCLGIAHQIMGKSSTTVLGGSSGDEESCIMMGHSREDLSDEEDGNSFEGESMALIMGIFTMMATMMRRWMEMEMEIKRETAK